MARTGRARRTVIKVTTIFRILSAPITTSSAFVTTLAMPKPSTFNTLVIDESRLIVVGVHEELPVGVAYVLAYVEQKKNF